MRKERTWEKEREKRKGKGKKVSESEGKKEKGSADKKDHRRSAWEQCPMWDLALEFRYHIDHFHVQFR